MEIIQAEIHNILSIENITRSFGSSGLVLYEGWNLDDDRANGAGKSAIFNAICFGVYEKVPRKITKTEILRKGTKNGYSKVDIRANNHVYTVKRFRPTAVEYYIDGVKSDITQEEFEKNIGFTYEQFLITMYTAQNTQNKFIFLNDNGKKEFILELMKLGVFQDFHKSSKKLSTDLEKKILVLVNELKNLCSKVDIYKESLVDEREVVQQIISHEQEITSYRAKIITLQEVQRPDISKYTDLENKIMEANNQFRMADAHRYNMLQKYNEYKRASEQAFIFHTPSADANCPDCDTPLVVSGKQLFHLTDTSAQEAQLRVKHSEAIEDAKRMMKETLELIQGYDEELTSRPQVQALETKLIAQKKKDFKDYDVAQATVADYDRCLTTRTIYVSNLNSKLDKNKEVQGKIRIILKEAIALKTKKLALQEELETVKFCAQVFAPTGAPAYIMDSVIESFNEAVSGYVQLIWPSATYQLQTYKVNSDKTIVAKFSEELIIGGKKCSIGSLSGGELRSLSLALDFAILDVLSAQYGITLNPIVLDEALDGLDSVGRETVINLLSHLSQKRQIIVIDHSIEIKALFTDVVKIEKKNGISTIVDE